MFLREGGALLREHACEEGDGAEALRLLGGLELELELRQDGEENARADVVQLVDQLVHLAGDGELRIRLPQNQGLK